MIPWVIEAKYMGGYRVWVSFNDGAEGEVDLSSELEGEIFEPLRDISYFKNFKILGHTLAWENGADFAPEFLRESIMNTVIDSVS
ncbi:hypothetical protein MCHI_002405 [Candidatus Magnetoovum chiemensis]|nr:hypothetical protein MCHI_002405 [Candidatus Magnetoovum chiemensis]